MTKQEYEEEISKLNSEIQELQNLTDDMNKQIRKVIRLIDYLPDVDELDDDNKVNEG